MAPSSLWGSDLSEVLRGRVEVTSARGAMVASGEALKVPSGVVDFYQRRGFALAWFDGGAPTAQAKSMAKVIADVRGWGLRPATYHSQVLLAHPAFAGKRARFEEAEQVDFDLLLTDAWLTLARHVVMGRVSATDLGKDILMAPREMDFPQALEDALGGPGPKEAMLSLHPKDPDYTALLEALSRYREIEASGGWGPVAVANEGDGTWRCTQLQALQARLNATGDLPGAPLPISPGALTCEDTPPEIEASLKGFQGRHGLAITGALDEPTLAAIDVPVAQRIEAIELSLERWRWLPQELGPRHIRVNIPSYRLEVRDGQDDTLTMKVIVGRTYRKTPMFSSKVSYLVLNPTWTVPPNIAAQDKFPLIKKDPAYLSKNKMILFEGHGSDAKVVDPSSIDWSGMTASQFNKRYRIQQSPGPHNALGQVKFMFPNAFNVYLHDTNTRDLFDKEDRSLSSGCIRLAQPLDLAKLLLAKQAEGEPGRIEKILKGGKETSIILKEKVPVHLMYFTAWPEGEGLHFRQDLYGRDDALKEALTKLEGPRL